MLWTSRGPRGLGERTVDVMTVWKRRPISIQLALILEMAKAFFRGLPRCFGDDQSIPEL